MKIALITPDRGDRPEFLEHCKWQMERQTVKNLNHYIISDKGIDGVVDIVPRIREGIHLASKDGIDYCFVIENDDYYPDDYIEKLMFFFKDDIGLLGLDRTIYYSLQSKSWTLFSHPGRASLFCTAFRISALRDYQWPDNQLLYFDRHLWTYRCKKIFPSMGRPPIGIKHGIGFCPGNYHNGIVNGHQAKDMHEDKNMRWLERRIRPESFEFYQKYSLKLAKTE